MISTLELNLMMPRKSLRNSWLKCLVLVAALFGCAGRKDDRRPYVFLGDQNLDIDGVVQSFDTWRPKTPGPHPLVMLIHGGGWEKGRDYTDMRSIGDRFAENGYFVLNVSYRYAPNAKFPTQIQDLVNFLEWAQAHREQFSIDTCRTLVVGYSAGAQLALMLSYVSTDSLINRPLPQDLRIRAVVAGGAPSDLTRFPDSPLVQQLIRGSEDPNSEAYRQALLNASPIHWASASSPPTFLYHGKQDWIVDVEQSRALAKKLGTLGVPVEFLEPRLGHIYNFLFDETEIRAALEFAKTHVKGSVSGSQLCVPNLNGT